MQQRDFGGTPGSRGLTPGKLWRLRQTRDKPAGQEHLELDREAGAENIHSKVEVESVPIARVGNPTA